MSGAIWPAAQRGSVLIVSLIFLLLLTIVGVSAMNMTSLEEKMSGNFRDHDLAFQASEAALIEAEDYVEANFDLSQALQNGSQIYKNPCASGLCFHGTFTNSSSPVSNCTAGETKEWEAASLWGTASKTRLATAQLDGTAKNARYIIEFRCFMPKDPGNPDPDVTIFAQWAPAFRITSLASGASTDSQVMLQSTYRLVK